MRKDADSDGGSAGREVEPVMTAATRGRSRKGLGIRRWMARVLGFLVLLLFARQASHEVAHLAQGRSPGDAVFSFGLLAVVAGLIVGWFVARVGAVVIWLVCATALVVAGAARAAGIAGNRDLAAMALAFGIPAATAVIYWTSAASGKSVERNGQEPEGDAT